MDRPPSSSGHPRPKLDADNRAVAPTRLPNSKYRGREHLTPSGVEKLIEAAKTNRYGHRDATMLLVTFRHGLRCSELCGLEWSRVDFRSRFRYTISNTKLSARTANSVIHVLAGPVWIV
jgi:integrase